MAESSQGTTALEKFKAFSSTQKAALVLAVVGVLAVLYFLAAIALQPRYTPLFSGLDLREAASIKAKLDEMQVPYRISGEGTTIEVPEDRVYNIRLELASSGALSGIGVGFEIFDKTKLGITEFEQQVNYQRALQEELRRTIVQLSEVEQARVHLVIPEKSVFAEERPEPTASIALRLKPLAKLEPRQVQGIVSLVTGSVEGLKPENVHIIDMNGNILDNPTVGDNFAATTLSQLEIKRNFEKQLENRVQQMLEQVLGPGKAVAMITAELDFSRQETVSSIPEGQIVVSEQTITEQGQAGGASGPAGTGSQYEEYFALDGAGGAGQSREETITNYQVGTRQQTVIKPPGDIIRLSTAVVLDGNLTPAKTERIRNIVATAIGFDEARGDQIQVTSMAFDKSYLNELEDQMNQASAAAQKKKEQELVLKMIIAGAAALLGLILLIVFFIWRRRSRRRARQEAETLISRMKPETMPETSDEWDINIEKRREQDREKLCKIAEEHTRDVADIIKIWLREKRRG
ncbi:MAG: flagellar M-ring protein FliF [Peptococcaceae bacterium]|nr:flagellar M-ring protein FliF [Peptococcaceae bacterium]